MPLTVVQTKQLNHVLDRAVRDIAAIVTKTARPAKRLDDSAVLAFVRARPRRIGEVMSKFDTSRSQAAASLERLRGEKKVKVKGKLRRAVWGVV
jgi:hypothetical protein